jgi:cytidine deaminase
MIKGVLFDMDGVLLDSEELTAEAAINYFSMKGYTVVKDDFIPFLGTGEKGYFGGVAAKYGIPYDNIIDAEKIYSEYERLAEGKIEPLPGVIEFIAACRIRNMKLAVATSAMMLKLNINLRLLGFDGDTFDTVVCGDDIRNNKPDPEIFLTAAGKLNLIPAECLVIEDSPAGVEAAKRAGCLCLAVSTRDTESSLTKADWVVRSLVHYPHEIFR